MHAGLANIISRKECKKQQLAATSVFKLFKVLSRGRVIFVPSVNVRLKGQVKNLTLGQVDVRSGGDTRRSCCISADAFRRGTQIAAIPIVTSLFYQKLETQNQPHMT